MAGLVAVLWAQPLAAADVTARKPSSTELARLREIDRYIRYFSALSYDDTTVPADYIRALILAESSGDPRAVSSSGAIGLTQILPVTGRTAAQRLITSGFDFSYVDERMLGALTLEGLHDPAINILIACFLSASYGRQFDGRLDLMAAAWNVGPDAVARNGNAAPAREQAQLLVGRVLSYIVYFKTEAASAGR